MLKDWEVSAILFPLVIKFQTTLIDKVLGRNSFLTFKIVPLIMYVKNIFPSNDWLILAGDTTFVLSHL